MLTEDIIIKPEPEKQEKKSHFAEKILKLVRFWFKLF